MMRNSVSRILLSLLALSVLLFSTPAFAFNQPSSRNGGLPIWTPLTPFEIETVKALQTDDPPPETLLAFAILMGGELRYEREIRPYIARYQSFVSQIRKDVESVGDRFTRGKFLHDLFHDVILGEEMSEAKKKGRNKASSNYELNQTRVDIALATGRYNCASSAMLFGILAYDFGFSAKGVILPEHVFVELAISGRAKPVEVETTSIKGYGWTHDKKFYEKQQRRWAANRGLGQTSYQDYLNRKIVSLKALIAKSFNLQHTRRLTEAARLRITEIAAAVVYNPTLYLDRIKSWNNQVVNFANQKRYKEALGLLYYIENIINRDYLSRRDDREIQKQLSWYFSYRGIYLARVMPKLAALDDAEYAFQFINRRDKHYASIDTNYIFVTTKLVEAKVNEGDYEGALKLAKRAKQWTDDKQSVENLMAAIYGFWGSYYFRQGAWEEAIAIYRQCLTLASSKGRVTCAQNMQGAFLNYSRQFQISQEHDKAGAILKRCLKESALIDECRQTLQRLEEALRRQRK